MSMKGVALGRQTPLLSCLEVLWAQFNETLMKEVACLKSPVKCSQMQLCCCCILLLSHVVVFSSSGLPITHVVLCSRAFMDPGYNMRCVLRLPPASCALLLYPAAL